MRMQVATDLPGYDHGADSCTSHILHTAALPSAYCSTHLWSTPLSSNQTKGDDMSARVTNITLQPAAAFQKPKKEPKKNVRRAPVVIILGSITSRLHQQGSERCLGGLGR